MIVLQQLTQAISQAKLKAFQLGSMNPQLSKTPPFVKKKEQREEKKRVCCIDDAGLNKVSIS